MKNKKIILLLLLTALTMSCMSVGGTKTITISGLGVVQAVPVIGLKPLKVGPKQIAACLFGGGGSIIQFVGGLIADFLFG